MPCSPDVTPSSLEDIHNMDCENLRTPERPKGVLSGSTASCRGICLNDQWAMCRTIQSFNHTVPERIQHQTNNSLFAIDMQPGSIALNNSSGVQDFDGLFCSAQASLPWREHQRCATQPVRSTMAEVGDSVMPEELLNCGEDALKSQLRQTTTESPAYDVATDGSESVIHHLELNYAHHTHYLHHSHHHHYHPPHSSSQNSHNLHLRAGRGLTKLTSDGGDDHISSVSDDSATEAHLEPDYPHHHHHYHYHHHHCYRQPQCDDFLDALPRSPRRSVVDGSGQGADQLTSLTCHYGSHRFRSIDQTPSENEQRVVREEVVWPMFENNLSESAIKGKEEQNISNHGSDHILKPEVEDAPHSLRSRILLWLNDVQDAAFTIDTESKSESESTTHTIQMQLAGGEVAVKSRTGEKPSLGWSLQSSKTD